MKLPCVKSKQYSDLLLRLLLLSLDSMSTEVRYLYLVETFAKYMSLELRSYLTAKDVYNALIRQSHTHACFSAIANVFNNGTGRL